jgi:hypothetical protein
MLHEHAGWLPLLEELPPDEPPDELPPDELPPPDELELHATKMNPKDASRDIDIIDCLEWKGGGRIMEESYYRRHGATRRRQWVRARR